jgi:hypothetical protein
MSKWNIYTSDNIEKEMVEKQKLSIVVKVIRSYQLLAEFLSFYSKLSIVVTSYIFNTLLWYCVLTVLLEWEMELILCLLFLAQVPWGCCYIVTLEPKFPKDLCVLVESFNFKLQNIVFANLISWNSKGWSNVAETKKKENLV